MRRWSEWRLARYEGLKQRAEEQNRVKEDIERKITSPKPGDRVLTRKEYRILGRGLGGWTE